VKNATVPKKMQKCKKQHNNNKNQTKKEAHTRQLLKPLVTKANNKS